MRAEGIVISGGIVRARQQYDYFKRLRMNTKPSHGPFHYAAPARMLWRTVRGMVPHKTKRGAAAFERFKAYEGIPPPYDKVKRAVVPEALKVLRLAAGHKYCVLADLSHQVGWKHKATVEALEAKRRERFGVLGEEEGGQREVCRREGGGERAARRPRAPHRRHRLLKNESSESERHIRAMNGTKE